jgi:TRAP transporter TAXI family solute receptor
VKKILWKWRLADRQPGQLSLRDLTVVALPLALIAVAAFWFAYQFVKPAPPSALVMSTGSEGGTYQAYALRYRDILARDAITLELRPSSGAVENLQRLQDYDSGVDVGFVQGGIGTAEEAPGLVSLGAMYYEPVWLFYRGGVLDRLIQLKGKRIAIGREGSGTRRLARQLLAANDVSASEATLLDVGLTDAARAFKAGRIDAALVIAGPESPAVQELLRMPGLRLMNISQAAAYTRLFPFLSNVTLPQGSIDLVRNIPERDTVLLATTANLVARADLHPALMSLLIQAATEVHGGTGAFQRAGEFPQPLAVDFPLGEEAKRQYRSGTPFLQRYLPFWLAILVERMVVLLVPLVVILIPLFRILPPLYSWQVRSRMYRWYGELKFLEREVEADRGEMPVSGYLERLDRIERNVNGLKVPLAFTSELYTLRQHIDFVREKIGRSRPN